MKKRPVRKPVRRAKRGVNKSLVAVLVLSALAAAAYWNSFDVPLIFDDYATIAINPIVQFGDALAPSQLFSRALLYLTFAANYYAHGENVWGYHLVNLLFHLLNGILIYVLARDVFSRVLDRKHLSEPFAALAAAFFVVHPVQTESVTYISSRSELLSTMFYLIAVLLFVRTPPDRIGFRLSLIVGVLFLLGIGSKETVISLPAALLLYDFIFLSGGRFSGVLTRWRFYAAFFAGGLAIGLYLAIFKLATSIGGGAPGNLSAWHYFLTQLRVIVRYIQITLAPAGLNLAYDFRPSTGILEPQVVLSGLFLLAIVAIGWRLRTSSPIAAFSIFWFFLTLAPTSSVVAIRDVIYDHRLYLPMAGLCLSFPLSMDFLQRSVFSRANLRISAVQAGAVFIALLTVGTVMRNEVWRDEARLWSDVIAKSPSLARGYSGLAQAHFVRGEVGQAIQVSLRGAENVPENSAGFYSNIGHFFLQQRRFDEARGAFAKVVEQARTSGERARAYHNTAITYLYESSAGLTPQEKDRALAMTEEALLKSIELDADYLPSWDSYINVVVQRGRPAPLRGRLQDEIRSREAPRARYGLGKLAFHSGAFAEAVTHFALVEEKYKDEKTFWFNYAYALEEAGDSEAAMEKYETAVRIDSLFMEANYNLAQLYMEKGSLDAAIRHFGRVLRTDPRSTLAHLQLARIYIQRGQRALARNHLSAVLDASPENPEATALLQQTL
jgi:tetratricopeptide (TPR) repeat protein